MKHPTKKHLNHYVCGFAFSRGGQFIALIEKKKEWCKGRWNGIGGSIEETDASPLDAQRREFLEETGLSIQNWEYFCTLEEPNAVVEFFRADVPLNYLDQVRSTTEEIVRIIYWPTEGLQLNLMPNLRWLVPLAQTSGGVLANVTELDPQVGLCGGRCTVGGEHQ